jgi:hypothetical protein
MQQVKNIYTRINKINDLNIESRFDEGDKCLKQFYCNTRLPNMLKKLLLTLL